MGHAYVLKLSPIFQERIWGVSGIASVYAPFPQNRDRIGEVWLTAGHNRVTNGSWKDRPLDDVWNDIRAQENPHSDIGERFPLLVKFLFTSDNLSVQVHPPDDFAQRHEAGRGKTEMWHVVGADPPGTVAIGLVRDYDADELRRLAESGGIQHHLQWTGATAGDSFYVPAGTIHAIGKGLTICEIQQNSDVTYRLDDYGREDAEGNRRPLHVEKAVQVARRVRGAGRLAPAVWTIPEGTRRLLAACPYFTTEGVSLEGRAAFQAQGTPEIWVGLEGAASVELEDTHEVVRKGEAVVVAGRWTTLDIRPAPTCRLIRTYLPPNPAHPAADWSRENIPGWERVVFPETP